MTNQTENNIVFKDYAVKELMGMLNVKNPRTINEENKKLLSNSLSKFGVVEPIVVNLRTNQIVGGHQRIKVAYTNGVEKLPCVTIDIDENREKAFNILLNKAKGDWDYSKLTVLLKEINNSNNSDLLLFTGFNTNEIETLIGEQSRVSNAINTSIEKAAEKEKAAEIEKSKVQYDYIDDSDDDEEDDDDDDDSDVSDVSIKSNSSNHDSEEFSNTSSDSEDFKSKVSSYSVDESELDDDDEPESGHEFSSSSNVNSDDDNDDNENDQNVKSSNINNNERIDEENLKNEKSSNDKNTSNVSVSTGSDESDISLNEGIIKKYENVSAEKAEAIEKSIVKIQFGIFTRRIPSDIYTEWLNKLKANCKTGVSPYHLGQFLARNVLRINVENDSENN